MTWERLEIRKDQGGLGFRDIRGFNLALMGKQIWRLIMNPGTLVSRIYKAKYYPTGNIFSAALGHRPSFVWRSLCEARSVVHRGLCWKIGDGESIRVWGEPWLREPDSLFLDTPMPHQAEDLRVCDLFLPCRKEWDINMIEANFTTRDTTTILSLPVCSSTGMNRLIWHYNNNGIYTVRSAYRVYLDQIADRSNHAQPGEWRRLWKLQVPPKMAHFIWRIAHQVLATRGRLRQRGTNVNGQCGVCGKEYETDWHLFLECEYAHTVWQEAGWADMMIPANEETLEFT
ncbi:Putative ribonuclease H protein At1g65750 [Linum grandiflorum]